MSTLNTNEQVITEELLHEQLAVWEAQFRILVDDKALWTTGFKESRRVLSRLNKKRRALGLPKHAFPVHILSIMAEAGNVKSASDEQPRLSCITLLQSVPSIHAVSIPAPVLPSDNTLSRAMVVDDSPVADGTAPSLPQDDNVAATASIPPHFHEPPSLMESSQIISVQRLISVQQTPEGDMMPDVSRSISSGLLQSTPHPPQSLVSPPPIVAPAETTCPPVQVVHSSQPFESVVIPSPPSLLPDSTIRSPTSEPNVMLAPTPGVPEISPSMPLSSLAHLPTFPTVTDSGHQPTTSDEPVPRPPPLTSQGLEVGPPNPPRDSESDDSDGVDPAMIAKGPFILGPRREPKASSPAAPSPHVKFMDLDESSLTESEYVPDSSPSPGPSTSGPQTATRKGKGKASPQAKNGRPQKEKYPESDADVQAEVEAKSKKIAAPRRRKNVSRADKFPLLGPYEKPCEHCLKTNQPEKCIQFDGSKRLACSECFYAKIRCSYAPPPKERKALKIKIKRQPKQAEESEDGLREVEEAPRPRRRTLKDRMSNVESKFDKMVTHFAPGGPSEYLPQRLSALEDLPARIEVLERYVNTSRDTVHVLASEIDRQHTYNESTEAWIERQLNCIRAVLQQLLKNPPAGPSVQSLGTPSPPPTMIHVPDLAGGFAAAIRDHLEHVVVPPPSVPSATIDSASAQASSVHDVSVPPAGTSCLFSESSDAGKGKRKVDDVDDSMVIDERAGKRPKL